MPSAAEILFRIASRCGPIFGASAIRVASTLMIAAVFRRQNFADPAQDFETADAADRFVAVWKMMADVALADRA